MVRVAFCYFHRRDCVVLKEPYFCEKSMDYRIDVDCGITTSQPHDPVPNIIFLSEKKWLIFEIKQTKKQLIKLEKKLKGGLIDMACKIVCKKHLKKCIIRDGKREHKHRHERLGKERICLWD